MSGCRRWSGDHLYDPGEMVGTWSRAVCGDHEKLTGWDRLERKPIGYET